MRDKEKETEMLMEKRELNKRDKKRGQDYQIISVVNTDEKHREREI